MNTNAQDPMDVLSQVGAIVTGSHIVYTSGKHGSSYVNKDAIYPHTALTSGLCMKIAARFANHGIEVVMAPVIGGVILSQWVAHHLTALTGKEVLGVYAEKDGDGFVIKRGYDKIVKGRRVLVVEDILNTGGSVKKVVEATRAAGGMVAGVGALCNRGKVVGKDVGAVPLLYSIVDIDMAAWGEEECPLCAKNQPINLEVGKGREYIAKKRG